MAKYIPKHDRNDNESESLMSYEAIGRNWLNYVNYLNCIYM